MGCAIHTTLPAGVGYTTTDLHVRYTRAMHAGQGLVLAEGNVVHSGSRTATAEGRLYLAGDEDVLFAHASAGCVILAPSSSWRSSDGARHDVVPAPMSRQSEASPRRSPPKARERRR